MQDLTKKRIMDNSYEEFLKDNSPYQSTVKSSKLTQNMKMSNLGNLNFEFTELGYRALLDRIDEYKELADTSNVVLTKAGLCAYLGLTEGRFKNIVDYDGEDEWHVKFAEALEFALLIIKGDIINGSMMNEYNPTIAKVALSKDHDYREVVSSSTTGTLTTNVINIVDDIED